MLKNMNRADRDLANETSVSGKVDAISHLLKEVAQSSCNFCKRLCWREGTENDGGPDPL